MSNSQYDTYLPVCRLMNGKYCDVLKKSNGKLIEFGWRSNVIVYECRALLAAFMAGQTASGINQIRLGRGDEQWDDLDIIPSPSADTNTLVDTSAVSLNVAPGDITFISTLGDAVVELTATIEITINIAPGVLNSGIDEVFPLREFALFGQIDTTPFMIDYVRHAVMNIGSGDALTRRIRLAF